MKPKNFFPELTKGSDWSLFLDRDGVINRRLVDDYVKSWDDFEFLPSVLSSLAEFASRFRHIVVVTNQQGVGKGLMTRESLQMIHAKMVTEIVQAGGRIDQVFFCPDLSKSNSINRKPNIGMGLQARKAYPAIRFRQSVMIGDSISDMQFGKRLRMKTILIPCDAEISRLHSNVIDFCFPDMQAMVDCLPV